MTIEELLEKCDLCVATEETISRCEPFSCGNDDLDEFFAKDVTLYQKNY